MTQPIEPTIDDHSQTARANRLRAEAMRRAYASFGRTAGRTARSARLRTIGLWLTCVATLAVSGMMLAS